jgi:hypothetical protein
MADQYFLDRFGRREANLRAADADRERTAERLRSAHAEGRLDIAEFQERLDRCYEAKTFGQLDQLVSDLPRQDQPGTRRATGLGRSLHRVPLVLLALVAVLVVSALSGDHHHAGWLWLPFVFLVWRFVWWPRARWSRRRW